jgi:hypothetical protein
MLSCALLALLAALYVRHIDRREGVLVTAEAIDVSGRTTKD